MPKPKELLAFGERWRPYRTVASWYMWRAFERAGYATQQNPPCQSPQASSPSSQTPRPQAAVVAGL